MYVCSMYVERDRERERERDTERETETQREREKAESRRSLVVPPETDVVWQMELYLVSYSHVVMHRLVDMG